MSDSYGYLKIKEVAEMLRVSNMTVHRLITAGELEAVRVGRLFRVTEKALTAYLEKNKT